MRFARWALAFFVAGAILSGGEAWGAASGRTLTVGTGGDYASLAEAIQRAQVGDTVQVVGGSYAGPVVIDKTIKLQGIDWPVINGNNHGSVVHITAEGVHLSGFRVQDSGGSMDREDAGVLIEAANVTVADNEITGVLFGIVAKRAPAVIITGNRVEAKRRLGQGMVGDGIRVWFSHDAQVLNNTIGYFRDCLIDQSQRALFQGNVVHDGLIGLHTMRTIDVTVIENNLSGNSVGLYAMSGTGIVARRNIMTDNGGPSGYGVGLKDMSKALVEDNWIARNRVGIYYDNSPINPGQTNWIQGNVIQNNDIGMLFTPITNGNHIGENDMVDNFTQVGVSGGGRLGDNDWTPEGKGNYWSNYGGYDAAGDGVGDLPHREEGLFERLMDRQPKLRWFRFTPSAAAVDLAARAFPAVAPEPVLVDEAPRMVPLLRAPLPPTADRSFALAWVGLGCLALAALLGMPLLGWPSSLRAEVKRGGAAA